MPDYKQSYFGKLRKLIGKEKVFLITARAIIRDREKRVLFVRHSDHAQWVMPAGSMELGESILDCVQREVKEESGLDVISATPMAIYSEPRFSFVTAYGDPYQPLSVVFIIDEWSGTLISETDETVDARFFPLEAFPQIPEVYIETLSDLKQFDGKLILK